MMIMSLSAERKHAFLVSRVKSIYGFIHHSDLSMSLYLIIAVLKQTLFSKVSHVFKSLS